MKLTEIDHVLLEQLGEKDRADRVDDLHELVQMLKDELKTADNPNLYKMAIVLRELAFWSTEERRVAQKVAGEVSVRMIEKDDSLWTLEHLALRWPELFEEEASICEAMVGVFVRYFGHPDGVEGQKKHLLSTNATLIKCIQHWSPRRRGIFTRASPYTKPSFWMSKMLNYQDFSDEFLQVTMGMFRLLAKEERLDLLPQVERILCEEGTTENAWLRAMTLRSVMLACTDEELIQVFKVKQRAVILQSLLAEYPTFAMTWTVANLFSRTRKQDHAASVELGRTIGKKARAFLRLPEENLDDTQKENLLQAVAWAVQRSRDIRDKKEMVNILMDQIRKNDRFLTGKNAIQVNLDIAEALWLGCDKDEIDRETMRQVLLHPFPDGEEEIGPFRRKFYQRLARTFGPMFLLPEEIVSLITTTKSTDDGTSWLIGMEALVSCNQETFKEIMMDRFPYIISTTIVPWSQNGGDKVEWSLKPLARRILARLEIDGEEENQDCDMSWFGVSVPFMKALTYHPLYYKGLRTCDLLDLIVKPMAKHQHEKPLAMQIIDMEDLDWEFLRQNLGRATLSMNQLRPFACTYATDFMSHSWSYQYDMVVDAATFGRNAENLPPTYVYYIWFDLFSVNQFHAPNRPSSWWDTTFRNCVGSFGDLMLAIDSISKPKALSRIWCIWEVFSAIDARANVTLCFPVKENGKILDFVGQGAENLEQVFETFDVKYAEASIPSDRDRILNIIDGVGQQLVQQEPLSLEKVNHVILSFFSSFLVGYAAYGGRVDVLSLLEAHGAPMDQPTTLMLRNVSTRFRDPLGHAIGQDQIECCKFLACRVVPTMDHMRLILHKFGRTWRKMNDPDDDETFQAVIQKEEEEALNLLRLILHSSPKNALSMDDMGKLIDEMVQGGFSTFTEDQREAILAQFPQRKSKRLSSIRNSARLDPSSCVSM